MKKKAYQVDVIVEMRYPIAVIADDAMEARELADEAYLREEAACNSISSVWHGVRQNLAIIPVCTMGVYGKKLWNKHSLPMYTKDSNGEPRILEPEEMKEFCR